MHAVMGSADPVVFETRREAEQWATTVLGDWAGDYDIAAICSECFAFDEAVDDEGTVHLDRQGVRLAVTADEFWASVQRNERPPQRRGAVMSTAPAHGSRFAALTARRVRSIIAQRGLSLPDVAAHLGAPGLADDLDVHGRRSITLGQLGALAEALDVPVAGLLG